MTITPDEPPSTEPLDLSSAMIADFEPHVGSAFFLHTPENEPVELKLIQTIDEHREANAEFEFRRPFSLVFEAPNDFIFPQNLRVLKNSDLGEFQAFLIPSGVVDGKTRYHISIN